MKRIYVIRHCEAEGQPPESKLTENGLKQALALSAFFSETKIDRIISSPYTRAIGSIQPLANRLNIEIELDRNLAERVLSTNNLPDWLEKLRATYDDLDLKFEGGESSRAAMNRIVEVVEGIFNSEKETTILVTHGNIMSLLLKYFNNDFGFEEWKKLSNPDVFLLEDGDDGDDGVSFERVWRKNLTSMNRF